MRIVEPAPLGTANRLCCTGLGYSQYQKTSYLQNSYRSCGNFADGFCPIGGVASKRVCTCSLCSQFIMIHCWTIYTVHLFIHKGLSHLLLILYISSSPTQDFKWGLLNVLFRYQVCSYLCNVCVTFVSKFTV